MLKLKKNHLDEKKLKFSLETNQDPPGNHGRAALVGLALCKPQGTR